MKKILLSITTLCLLSSCTRQILIKLSPKPPEIYSNTKLKTLLSKTSLSIVLRVPSSISMNLSEYSEYNIPFDDKVVYNTIEKEMMKAGFIIRDRAIFEKVTARYDLDYSTLNSLSNTDLVLQVMDIKPIDISTNKFYTTNGIEQKSNINRTFVGRSFEFRLISIKDNEVLGSYTFYYVPCSNEGCSYMMNDKGILFLPNSKKVIYKGYEFMSPEITEEFTKLFTQQLIHELQK